MPEPITDFSKGIQSHPAFEGSFQGAADMLNWEIDEIGRPALRSGYIVSQETEYYGRNAVRQDQVIKVHFAGDRIRRAFSKLFRLPATASWVYSNGRLIVTGDGNPYWIDVDANVIYDWTLAAPIGHITVPDRVLAYDSNDVPTHIINKKFAICYTWSSSKFGITTPASRSQTFDIRIPKTDDGADHVDFDATIIVAGRPAWADVLKIYITIAPFGDEDYREFREQNQEVLVGGLGPGAAVINTEGLRLAPFLRTTADTTVNFDTDDILNAGYRYGLVRTITGANRLSNPATENFRVQLLYNTTLDSDGDDENSVQLSNDAYRGILYNVPDDPPPGGLDNIVSHAGRVWGYDKNANTINYSMVVGSTSSHDIFPNEEFRVPHIIRLEENLQSPVIKLHPISQNGGLYVFFSNSIRTITGKAIITGLFSPETPPQTDLDASGGYDGIGTLSPRSVVSFREMVLFLGTDKTIYQLLPNTLPQDLGLNVQTFLDDITDDILPNVFAFGYNDCYYLSLPTKGILKYDTKRKYWTRYSWSLKSAFWSRGGSRNESILYAIDSQDRLVELHKGVTDDEADIRWGYQTHEWAFPMTHNLYSVFVEISGRSNLIEVLVRNEGEIVHSGEFVPSRFNRYRHGVFARGNLFSVAIAGESFVPRIQSISIE